MNDNKYDYNKISSTAVLCAKVRAEFVDLPYVNEIWEEVSHIPCALGVFYWSLKFISRFFRLKSMNKVSLLEGRDHAIDSAIEAITDELGVKPPVLEIASGLSARGLEFSEKGHFYIETDLPDMIRTKEQAVKKIREKKGIKDNGNHLFYPMDACNPEEVAKAGERYNEYWKNPLVIVDGGICMYLNDDEKKTFRDNIRGLLDSYSPNGRWVTPDFSMHNKGTDIIVKIAETLIKRMNTGRKMNYSHSHEEILNFLSEGGFSAEIIPGESVIDRMTCTRRPEIDVAEVRKLANAYDTYVMRLD